MKQMSVLRVNRKERSSRLIWLPKLRNLALLLCALLSLSTHARQWTDAQAGAALQTLRMERSINNIETIIAIGRDGPEASLLQAEVFAALADTGPSTLADNYAIEVLENPNSAEMLKFGALGYLINTPRQGMESIAVMAMEQGQPNRSRVVATYLAAQFPSIEVAESSAQALLANKNLGKWRIMALYALAEFHTPEELQSLASDSELPTSEIHVAMSYAGFRIANAETKKSLLGSWIGSRQPMLLRQALKYMCEQNLNQDFVGLGIVEDGETQPSGEVSMEPSWRKMIRKFGYKLLGNSNDFQIVTINPQEI